MMPLRSLLGLGARRPQALRSQPAWALAVVTSVIALAVAGCGSAPHSSSGKATLTVAVFDPFSGPNADYGYGELAGCVPAIDLINQDGGVLGHKLRCTIFDNRGDPADAVPAAEKMLLTSNLAGIIDSDSGLAPATVPLFERAKMTDLSAAGDVSLDKSTYRYFWRILPSDDVEGYALAAWAHLQGYTRVASIFGNDIAAQGNVPGLLAGARNLGVTITSNQSIALDQTAYETEIQKLLAGHPQAMSMESDPQTAAVLLGQLKQAGALMPFIGTPGDYTPDWTKAVRAAIGAADFKKYITIVNNYAPQTGSLWTKWDQALLAACPQIKDCKSHTTDFYAENAFDAANVMALAMVAAKSTTPSVYNPFIRKVTQPSPGAVVVHTFQQGKAALDSGKQIQYVGLTGEWLFDKYQNNPGVFAGFQGVSNRVLKIITPKELIVSEGR